MLSSSVKLLVIVIFVFFILMLLAGSEGEPRIASSRASTGDTVTFREETTFAVTVKDLDRLTTLSVANDLEGITDMLRRGEIGRLAPGTQVKVISKGFFSSELRLTDGRYVFVSTDNLYR